MPTDRLIGEEVRPEHLNDDVLGRALDDLYDYGVTELFRDLAARAGKKLRLSSRFAHLDATSFSFEGDYDSETGSNEPSEDGVVRIQQGYSLWPSPGPESGGPRHGCPSGRRDYRS